MTFSKFNSLKNQLQKDVPIYEPEYKFLSNYDNVMNMTTEELSKAIETSKDHIRTRIAMKPTMVFNLTQITARVNLPKHIKENIIDQLNKYEDCKSGETANIEIPLIPYPAMTFTCKKTHSEAHEAFMMKVQEIQKSNIDILKKYIRTEQQDQTNVSIIKTMCENINRTFPKLGNELWEISMDFIGSLTFRTTQEARLIIKKIFNLLKTMKFPSQNKKNEFIQEIIQMIKNCYTPPKRDKMANMIRVMQTFQSQSLRTSSSNVLVARTPMERVLFNIIPNTSKNKNHIQKRNKILKYLRENPKTPMYIVRRWAEGIKNGSFSLRELEKNNH